MNKLTSVRCGDGRADISAIGVGNPVLKIVITAPQSLAHNRQVIAAILNIARYCTVPRRRQTSLDPDIVVGDLRERGGILGLDFLREHV